MHLINLDMESGFVPVNDGSLYYEKAGAGKPIVFVHGFGLDCRMWDTQFLELSKQFQVIRYDARGFGKSSVPAENPYSHPEDLNALLMHLGISSACLVGLSMGGRIVLDYALQFPESCSALVLVDAALNGYTFKTFSLEQSYLVAKESGAENANEEWLNHEIFNPANNNIAASKTLKQMISTYSGWHWFNKNPQVLLNPPSIEQLHKIKQPVLVVVGQLDLPDFHDIADILSKQIPNAKTIVMPNAGHMCNMENPGLFNQTLTEFINSVM